MNNTLHILFLFFLSGLLTTVSAQERYSYELINQTRANFGTINSLYQDRAGMIWLGHFGKGLEYYDGKKIHRFHLKNEGAFADKQEVFVEHNGLLYLNYGHEIKLFDPVLQVITDSVRIEPALSGKGEISVLSINEKTGEIWAVYELHRDAKDPAATRFHILHASENQPLHFITERTIGTTGKPLIKIVDDDVIVKNEVGFARIDKQGKIVREFPLPDFELKEINHKNCLVDESGIIWFGKGWEFDRGPFHNTYGLFSLDSNTGDLGHAETFDISYQNVNREYGEYTLSLLEKKGDTLYINGYCQYNTSTGEASCFYNFRKDQRDQLTGGTAYAMIEDETGVIFIGGGLGIVKLTPQPDVFKLIPTLTLRGFVEDEKGLIYGCCRQVSQEDNYIVTYDPATDEVEMLAPSKHWYSAVYADGKLFYDLFVYDLGTGERKLLGTNSWNNNVVRGTFLNVQVGANELWRTCWYADQIHVFNMRTLEWVKKIPIPPLSGVPIDLNDMYLRTSDSTVWLGTYGEGIFIFSKEGDLLHHFTRNEKNTVPLPSNVVSSFYEDRDKNMWIGHGAGLSKMKPDLSGIEHFVIDEEDPDYYIVYGILPEGDRFLWLSTNEGVFRFDRQTGLFMDFPLNPLVMEMEYNRTSYYKARNGRMYLGGENPEKVNIAFYPDEVVDYYENEERGRANIMVGNFSKYDGEKEAVVTRRTGLQTIREITLQPGDRYFSLEFLLADYRRPEDNYYSFYLDGYEKDWNEPARNNNHIRYENLPPGTYTLKMRSALMRQNLPLNERHIKVAVLPYWYQTWWSKILFGLLLGAGLYGFYQIRIRRQFELQEAIRLRDLDNLKTRLYTNITHEFRTPLTVIMGMNDNITGHEQERNLIKRNAKNLLRLINQLLDLSKLDSGTLKMDAVQGDIISYLQYLTESFYSMASDKKVTLGFKTEVPSLIMDFDEVKVQHVIYNLLSNAIKFTRPGGKVALETSFTDRNGTELLRIRVKDTGIGIPEAELPHIFDRFYQVENNQERPAGVKTFSGTGIGLALTKELVEVMGGAIDVKSEEGWGTAFTVLLPVKRGLLTPHIEKDFEIHSIQNNILPDFESLPAKPDQLKGDKPLVLIVEDNSGVVTYLKSLLQPDYYVQVAINGQEGIDMALEHVPDLIITDVMMPEKNGYEVCEELKSDERTSHIPIVVLTAKADSTSRIEGLETGADAYLSKPFDKEELLVRIRKLLELRSMLQKRYAGMLSVNGHSDSGHGEPGTVQEPSLEDIFLQKLTSAVEDNLSNYDLSIPELCQLLHMSHTQLYRKLKALTGKTPSRFIRSIRLQKAMNLLKTSDLNISEVAYEVGFSDPNYFTRMFKEEYGKVPGEVR